MALTPFVNITCGKHFVRAKIVLRKNLWPAIPAPSLPPFPPSPPAPGAGRLAGVRSPGKEVSMSPLILSACLLSSLTRPLSPAEIRSRPEPGSLAFGLYALRAACSVREGMTMEETGWLLGKPNWAIDNGFRAIESHSDLGLVVCYSGQETVVGGKRDWSFRVTRVRFHSLPAFYHRPAR
jgi:hypothetical protein